MRKLSIAFAAAALTVAPAFMVATPVAAAPMTAQADTITDVSSHGGWRHGHHGWRHRHYGWRRGHHYGWYGHRPFRHHYGWYRSYGRW
jgi:hypothetical protein